MSKITFRADDDLVQRLEEFDASKSEVMRKALRDFLEGPPDVDGHPPTDVRTEPDSLDDLVAERVDAMIEDRLNDVVAPAQPQDVNVNISLDRGSPPSSSADSEVAAEPEADVAQADTDRKTTGAREDHADDDAGNTCGQCGENVTSDHVYCPNCGEKSTHRVFCDCGDELRSDWAFCPSCGRRTPAADVLDQA